MTQQSLVLVDPEYEGIILAAVLQRVPSIINGGIPALLQPDVFSVAAYRWLVGKGCNPPPPRPKLSEMIREEFTGADLEKHEVSLLRLYELDITEHLEGAEDSFRRYLSFQTLSAGVSATFTTFKKDRNVPLAIREVLTAAQKAEGIVGKSKLQVVDYADDWQRRQADRLYKRDNPDLHPRLRLGIPMLDQQVKMESGTVTAFLAPMKRYKSVILCSVAFASLLQGYNTTLCVLENSVDMTMSRLDSMVTQIGYDRIVNGLLTKGERGYADQVMGRLDSWQNRLKVIKGEPYQTGMAQIEPEFDRLAAVEGFITETFVYDYLNIGKASRSKGHDGRPLAAHELQTQIAFDLQGTAKKKGSPKIVVTAAQTNVEGLGLDKNGRPIKITAQHQGQSIGIGQAVDANLAVNLETVQTEDSGWQPPQLVISILYLRDGKIIQPDVPLVSIIDEMCIDRSMRNLWTEAGDGMSPPMPPM